MTDEADRKRELVADVNALRGGKARRVEDRFAVGVLDLIIKLPFKPILMAEGKMIEGFKFGPTPRQFVEGVAWQNAGVMVALIGWKGKEVFVSPWTEQADCRLGCVRGKISNTVDVLLAFLGEEDDP